LNHYTRPAWLRARKSFNSARLAGLARCRAVGLGRMPENHALRAPWCEECWCLLFLALREDVLYKRAPVAILPMVVV
jgi:hypothetical protein